MVQIDIPMPTSCYECPCHDGEYGRCQITGNCYYDEIPRSCPMIVVDSKDKGKWVQIYRDDKKELWLHDLIGEKEKQE